MAGLRHQAVPAEPEPTDTSATTRSSWCPAAHPPHGLVGQPTSVTLLIAPEVGSVQLLRGGDAGSDAGTGLLGPREGESIAGRAFPVEKDDPWGGREES